VAAAAYERAFLNAGGHHIHQQQQQQQQQEHLSSPYHHLMDGVQAAAAVAAVAAAGSPFFDIEQRLRKSGTDEADKLAHLMHLNNNNNNYNHNNNKRSMDDVLKKISSKMHIRDDHGIAMAVQRPESPKTRSVHLYVYTTSVL
jgi:hypothetical protein